MAYIYDPNLSEEENRKKEEEQNRLASGGGVIGGDTPAGSFPQGGAKEGSGTYTNLVQYLEKNKPQAADLSRKVGEQISEAGTQARTAAEGLVESAREQVASSRVPQSGIVEEAMADPTAVVGDPEKKAAFLREKEASYSGPLSLSDMEDYEDVQGKVKTAQERIDLSKTEPGRMELLRSLTPGGGQGKLALNQLLLSADPNARATLEAASTPYAGISDYLSAEDAALQDLARGAKEETEATRLAAREGTSGAFPSMQDQINARVAEMRKEAADRLALQQTAVQRGLLTPELTEGLGVGSPEEARKAVYYGNFLNSLYGTDYDPMDYFKVTGSPDVGIQPENVASAEDYARYAALAELLGQDPGFLSAANQNLAGTASQDYADLDFQGLRQIPQRLREEDQTYMDKYGATLDPDGRISISGDITSEGTPIDIVDRLKAIFNRGVGNLPSDMEEALQNYDAQRGLDRLESPYTPSKPPSPEQEHGGAPDDSIVETPPETETPGSEPFIPEPPPPHPEGYEYYGWLPDGTPIFSMPDEYGRQVPIYYDGSRVQAFGIGRDPVTGQVYLLGAV